MLAITEDTWGRGLRPWSTLAFSDRTPTKCHQREGGALSHIDVERSMFSVRHFEFGVQGSMVSGLLASLVNTVQRCRTGENRGHEERNSSPLSVSSVTSCRKGVDEVSSRENRLRLEAALLSSSAVKFLQT